MKHVIASITIGASLLLPSAGVVFATGQPGSPKVTCQGPPALPTPGNAASSPGSPFHEPGTMSATDPGGTAGLHYAGNTGNPTVDKSVGSANAVSQYDIACAKQMP
jgi:hypothetical protein